MDFVLPKRQQIMAATLARCANCDHVALFATQKFCCECGNVLPRIITAKTDDGLSLQNSADVNEVEDRIRHPEKYCGNCSAEEGNHEAIPLLEPGGSAANIFTLVAMSLGVGVFFLPTQAAGAGLLFGCILIVVFGFLSDFVMQAIVGVALSTGASSLEGLAFRAFGRVGPPIVSVALAVSLFTGNASHMAFIGQTLWEVIEFGCHDLETDVADAHYGRVQKTVALLVVGAIAMPLCFGKTLSSLRYMATFSVLWVILTVLVTSGYAIDHLAKHGVAKVSLIVTTFDSIAGIISIAMFAFSSMLTVFPVLAEAKSRHLVKRDVHVANFLITAFYLGYTIIGGLAYGTDGGSVLGNFRLNVYPVPVFKVGLMICITGLYPVINFPMVQAVDRLLFPMATSVKQSHRVIISISGLLLIVALVVGVGQVSTVFGLCGGLGMGTIAYWLPMLIALILLVRRDPPKFMLAPEDLPNLPSEKAHVAAPVGLFDGMRPVVAFDESPLTLLSGARSTLRPNSVASPSPSPDRTRLLQDTSDAVELPTSCENLTVGDLSKTAIFGDSPLEPFETIKFPGAGPVSPLVRPETRLYLSGIELAAHYGHRLSIVHPAVWLAVAIIALGLFAAVSSVISAVQTSVASPPHAPPTVTPISLF